MFPAFTHPALTETCRAIAAAIAALPQDSLGAQPPRAFFVGGCVRDALLSRPSDDADLEIYGVPASTLRALLERQFGAARVLTVGDAFAVLKLVVEPGVTIDLALPRRESKTGEGHADFAVTGDPHLSFEDACRRRDFTMNALLLDVRTGALIDPFHGEADIRARRLRVVDATTFVEDPLRIYRAVQFAARFEATLDPDTRALLTRMVEDGMLAHLSKERVTEELRKLFLRAHRPSLGLTLLRDLGIIARDYPELAACIGTPQEPEWHPEGDVWVHTLLVVDAAAAILARQGYGILPGSVEALQVMLGALCHDLGKPSTTKLGEKDGIPRIRSLGHEEAGVPPTETLLARWTFGASVLDAARVAAEEHLKPSQLYLQRAQGSLSPEHYVNAVRKLLKRIHPVPWQVLLAVAEADFRGRGIPNAAEIPFDYGDALIEAIRTHALDQAPVQPLLRGDDLLALGVAPGPTMGRLIAEIEALRDDGTIRTREDALEEIKKRLNAIF